MNPAEAPESSPPVPGSKATPLAYETITGPGEGGRRPAWVYAVAGIYAFLLFVFLTVPAWATFAFHLDDSDLARLIVCMAIFVGCGLSLMLVPVRAVRHRPMATRPVWIPVIGSGLLAGILVTGAGLALCEYLETNADAGFRVLIGGALVWGAWTIVFGIVAFRGAGPGVGMWLHRWLIAGSVLELLIAVPTHVIVRRRPDCCAGIATGFGICIGVAVMFVSFGPSVLLLYYRRGKQITRD